MLIIPCYVHTTEAHDALCGKGVCTACVAEGVVTPIDQKSTCYF